MKHIHFLIALHVLIVTAVCLLTYNFLALDGNLFNKPITYEDTIAQTTRTVYRPGDMVDGMGSFCVKRPVTVEVTYFLEDTYIRTYPTKVLTVPTGCFDNKTYEMQPIPLDAAPDTYHFVIQYTVHLNPFNTVQWQRSSSNFQVVK